VAIWLIFRIAHFSRADSDMLVVRALKISQMTDGGMPPIYDSMHFPGTDFVKPTTPNFSL
jgi:hypothetical protein